MEAAIKRVRKFVEDRDWDQFHTPDNLAKSICIEAGELLELVNPNSRTVLSHCKVEPSIAGMPADTPFQFMRQGYFCLDNDSTPERLVFNRSVSLKDGFKKK